MEIYFEAKRAFYNKTGLGNYSRWLLQAYSKYYSEDKLILLKPGNIYTEFDSLFHAENFQTQTYQNSFGINRMFNLYSLIKTPFVFHGLSGEIPMNRNKFSSKVLVTIHDLIFLSRRKDYKFIDQKIYTFKLKYALQNADQIIAISDFTKNEILKYCGIPSEKIKVILQNCNQIFYQKYTNEEIESSKKKYGLPSTYFISVSSFNQRKNLHSIVESYAIIPASERIPLIFIGGGNEKDKVIRLVHEKKLNSSFIFLNQVQAEFLPALYQGSSGLIYPSLMEGFGIPALEAMASGIPMIGHKGSAVEEAGGKAGLFVDCNSKDALASAIIEFQSNSKLRKTLTDQISVELARYDNHRLMESYHKLYHG